MTTDDSPPSSSFFHSSFYHDNALPLSGFSNRHTVHSWTMCGANHQLTNTPSVNFFHIFKRIKIVPFLYSTESPSNINECHEFSGGIVACIVHAPPVLKNSALTKFTITKYYHQLFKFATSTSTFDDDGRWHR